MKWYTVEVSGTKSENCCNTLVDSLQNAVDAVKLVSYPLQTQESFEWGNIDMSLLNSINRHITGDFLNLIQSMPLPEGLASANAPSLAGFVSIITTVLQPVYDRISPHVINGNNGVVYDHLVVRTHFADMVFAHMLVERYKTIILTNQFETVVKLHIITNEELTSKLNKILEEVSSQYVRL